MPPNRNSNNQPDIYDVTNRHERNWVKSDIPKRSDGNRSYWISQVFVNQGWCWAIDLVETESTDGTQQWDVKHICLGSETNIVPELYAIREMVLAGEGEHRYSSLMEALLWGYMDGKFKEGDNPLKDYIGPVEFVKTIWGDMEGERWDEFDEVARRVNSLRLFNYWVVNSNHKCNTSWR